MAQENGKNLNLPKYSRMGQIYKAIYSQFRNYIGKQNLQHLIMPYKPLLRLASPNFNFLMTLLIKRYVVQIVK